MIPPILVLTAVRIQPDAPAVEYRQPQLAAGNGMVAMTYGAGKSIYFSASRDNARTFGPPVMVSADGAMSLWRHRGPRVTILPNAIVITSVAGKPTDADLKSWRSIDNGETWLPGGYLVTAGF